MHSFVQLNLLTFCNIITQYIIGSMKIKERDHIPFYVASDKMKYFYVCMIILCPFMEKCIFVLQFRSFLKIVE